MPPMGSSVVRASMRWVMSVYVGAAGVVAILVLFVFSSTEVGCLLS